MTCDSDQFYGDQTLSAFELVNQDVPFSMLTSKEYTFFERFDRFTDSLEFPRFGRHPTTLLYGCVLLWCLSSCPPIRGRRTRLRLLLSSNF